MKLKFRAACFCLAGCSAPVLAAPPDMSPLSQAADIMNRCAGIALEIVAMPVPGDLVAAKVAAQSAQVVAAAKPGAAAADASQAPKMAGQAGQFDDQIKASVAKFDACGRQHQAAFKKSEAHLQSVSKLKLTPEEAVPVIPVVENYQKAQANLREAVQKLTDDKQVQAYVSKSLSTYYLK